MTYYLFLVKGWPQPATDVTRHTYEAHRLVGSFETVEEFHEKYVELHGKAVDGVERERAEELRFGGVGRASERRWRRTTRLLWPTVSGPKSHSNKSRS